MLSVKVTPAVYIFCYMLASSFGLQSPDENIILETEAIIRNATDNLFLIMNYKNNYLKVKQSFQIHSFFTNVTLLDHTTFNLIFSLSRAYKDNESEISSLLLNEILNIHRNLTEIDFNEKHKEDSIENIDEFLNNGEEVFELNESSGLPEAYDSFEIIDEINANLPSGNSFEEDVLTVQQNENIANNFKTDSFNEDKHWVSKPERRIFKGEEATIESFPFVASIHMFNGFQCAGSIIRSDLILTAASCLQLAWDNLYYRDNPAFLSVRAGSVFFDRKGESISVMEIFFHPDYQPNTLTNNIAILKLQKQFNLKNLTLEIIEIDQEEVPLSILTKGFSIVGWGAKRPGNILVDIWSNRLSSAVLEIYDHEECQIIYSKKYITLNSFCAGYFAKGSGACSRDVGDPGVVNGILVGVVSFGAPVCGAPDAPTVFTKVGYFASWIRGIMEQNAPTDHEETMQTIMPADLFLFDPTEHGSTLMTPNTIDIGKMVKQKLYRDLRSTMYKQFMNFLLR